MNTTTIPFRARARTIDHLGKGQIADTPTAVSELWKNGYDAYARKVALHTFDDDIKCGVIFDDGCGMTMQQVIDKWLVIGTDSKTTKEQLLPEDRFDLPLRITQGEKGIGRLSCAFLAPVTLLVTKKINSPYTALLIDWRFFENPYLSLDEIIVPVQEFIELSEMNLVCKNLIEKLRVNISDDTSELAKAAWEKFNQDEIKSQQIKTTKQRIIEFSNTFEFKSELYKTWEETITKTGKKDGGVHGTALFLLDINRELNLLTNSGDFSKENQELDEIRKTLIDTLRAFTDPFKEMSNDFTYEIQSYQKNNKLKVILNQSDVFDKQEFDALEHTVEGVVDKRGIFKGRVKAWGVDQGEISISPTINVEKLGQFEIKLGSFEGDPKKSSFSTSAHSYVTEKMEKYSGIMIFRDGLRVMPYGRPDNDFFEIEERRGRNAGRFFWASRRSIGQISISHRENPLLRDKAGREGFIKNQAARELKSVIVNLLIELADRFFGSKSDERKIKLAIVKKETEARKDAQNKARVQSQKAFKEQLDSNTPTLFNKLKEAQLLTNEITIRKEDMQHLQIIDLQLTKLEEVRGKLRTPVKPPKLGNNEQKYREYRDAYNEFSVSVFSLREQVNKHLSVFHKKTPALAIKQHFDRNQGILNSQISRHEKNIISRINDLTIQWRIQAKEDRASYYRDAIDIIENTLEYSQLEQSLNNLDILHQNLSDTFNIKYESILKVLNKMSEGVNLDFAFSMAEEEKAYFEDKANKLQALAQLGISVEVLSHELEQQDMLVTRGLNSLPSDIKKHPGYEMAFNAHKALTQQIRFLSPLKLSGYQLRQTITGKDIQNHIMQFFRDRFDRQRVSLVFGEQFLKLKIKDLPSRIYPTFVNILNNALYWVGLSEERKIHIDVIENKVIIANSGPPVDDDDVEKLFDIFYSRRMNGHGVGLYLCRENLAVAHHKIWYAQADDPTLIKNGANFIIEFNGMEIDK